MPGKSADVDADDLADLKNSTDLSESKWKLFENMSFVDVTLQTKGICTVRSLKSSLRELNSAKAPSACSDSPGILCPYCPSCALIALL